MSQLLLIRNWHNGENLKRVWRTNVQSAHPEIFQNLLSEFLGAVVNADFEITPLDKGAISGNRQLSVSLRTVSNSRSQLPTTVEGC